MTDKKLEDEELDEVREAFDYNDRDEDGLIDLEEFADMLDDLEADMSDSRRSARAGSSARRRRSGFRASFRA